MCVFVSLCLADVDQHVFELQAQIKQLQSDMKQFSEIIKSQQREIEILMRQSKTARDGSSNCTCDTFPNGTITVGTPSSGLINGVNINQLASNAIKNTGDQNIAGSLAVQKLQIGGTWTLSVSPNGDLQASSSSTSVLVNQLPDGIAAAAQSATNANQAASGAAQQATAVNNRVSGLSVGACNCQTQPISASWPSGFALTFVPAYCTGVCNNGFGAFGFDDKQSNIVICSYCINGADGSFERVLSEMNMSDHRPRRAGD